MIDFGFDKLALIGAVALIVIGPQRLPKVARTVGHLVGKAQRYMADVRAEVNRSIELEELNKMKAEIESAAREMQQSAQNAMGEFDLSTPVGSIMTNDDATQLLAEYGSKPYYKHPRKNWRIKRSAMPQWYKHQQGIRQRALSGAARVARYRPKIQFKNSSGIIS